LKNKPLRGFTGATGTATKRRPEENGTAFTGGVRRFRARRPVEWTLQAGEVW
jgi:hypothetical protein